MITSKREEREYQIEKGGAYPADHLLCRGFVRKRYFMIHTDDRDFFTVVLAMLLVLEPLRAGRR